MKQSGNHKHDTLFLIQQTCEKYLENSNFRMEICWPEGENSSIYAEVLDQDGEQYCTDIYMETHIPLYSVDVISFFENNKLFYISEVMENQDNDRTITIQMKSPEQVLGIQKIKTEYFYTNDRDYCEQPET